MEGLVPGRIVYYRLSADDAAQINRRRTNAQSIADRLKIKVLELVDRTIFGWPEGAQAHIGNAVTAGQECPAMVVAVWGGTCVNLKVMLDGTDTFWGLSRNQGEGPGTWRWMFDGQQKRYDPTAKASEVPPAA